MSYKNVTINAAATQAIVGSATKARVRVKDGQTQVRFTDRVSLVNLPDDEAVIDLYVKGNSRRLGLRSALSGALEAGTKVALEYVKYGWYALVPAGEGNVAASVSAK